MSRMLKRISISVLLTLFYITVHAASKSFEYHGIYYQLYNGNPYEVVVVKPDNSSYAETITIPDSIKYEREEEGDSIKASVVAINAWAFQNCQLTALTFPASIITIGTSAFYNCAIDTLIFNSWKQLCEEITFVNSDANPLHKANHIYFSSDTENEVTKWIIPEDITRINPYVFYDFKRMTSVTLPQSLTEIGAYAFQGCTGLKEISIPAGVNSIGSKAFDGCTGMKNQKVTFASAEALCQIYFEDIYANPLYYAHHLYYQNNTKEITALVLPNNVTAISSAAFAGGENIITVTIPENVKQFGTDAFLDCKSMQSVSYASTEHLINMTYDNEYASPLRYAQYVTITGGSIASITINQDISDNLFANAGWLNKVTIGSGCKTIGKSAFKGCKSLSTVVIEEGLEKIDNDAFKACEILDEINIPSTVTHIGTQAFRGCYKLKNITIPAGVETLFNEVFMYCTGLENVTIESTHIQNIPQSSFYGCTALKNVQLSNTIGLIGKEAFRKCSSLTVLPTGGNLRTISTNAFSECNSIQTLELPSSVNYISQGAFSDCKGLTQLIINAPQTSASEDKLIISNGVFTGCNNLGTIFTHASPAPEASRESFGGKTDIHLYYDNGATGYDVLPWNQFDFEHTTIAQRTITYNVDGETDSIQTYNIGEYVIPYTVSLREGWDFSGWQEDIPDVMPDSNLVINGYFTTKQLIGDLYYHLDPNTAKATVLYHNSYKGKKTITIPAAVTFADKQYNIKSIADTAFFKCDKLEGIVIPNSVTSIGKGAFKECTELWNEVTLPDSLTVLSDSLFYNCKNLRKIKMGAITEIGASAFNQCTNLNISTLPATIKKIGTLAFCNCKSLIEITIPASVTKFANRVFLGCESMEKVTFKTNQLDTLPSYTFQNCYKLKEFTIDPKTKLIEEGAFMNCRSLDVLKLPQGTIIGRIKDRAFIGCSGITQVNIPASVKALGSQVFNGCTKIKSVIMEGIEAPSALKTLFADTVYTSATLYIPTEAQFAYNNNEPWSLFTNKVTRGNHKLIYMVDGVQHGDTLIIQTGETIQLESEASVREANPGRIGRKFSGWRNVPAYQTMPDSDITITGAFQYIITYKDKEDGKELCKDSLWYGDKVVSPAKLDSLGYLPKLDTAMVQMPAKDVTINVTYMPSEGESDYQGIHYYFYTLGDNPHAEVMPNPGRTAYEDKEIIIPFKASYKGDEYPVTIIRNDAFKGCKNLTNIILTDSLKQIGTQAFAFCNKLKEINIPQSVETLGNECFQYCTSLASVSFADGSTLEVLPAYTFSGCHALSDVALPTSLKTIANDAFRGCKDMKEIVIPEKVDSIGEYVFLGCDSLKKITISNKLKLPIAHVNTFKDETYKNAELYVSSLEVQAHIVSPWDKFTLRLGESVIADPCSDPVITYDVKNSNRKLVVTCATEGATIVTNISVPDVKTTEDNEISLQKTFTVTAYATKTGMRRSNTVSQTFNFEVGDVNRDGKITAQDASLILQNVAGKISW